ncbi:MAG TPA: NAD(P)/FAD-dependent oxidoreductase [Acetobacteraceae bacterium]|nr:NAD(P)/FAD-dependent oxidoreductase [Acetobacteraceae bacterium]
MTPDLLIVGAGPAGISAAIEARAHALSVLLLDENAAPGGRIWQALEARGAQDQDDAGGLQTLHAFRACGANARWCAGVWAIEPDDGTVFWSQAATAHAARAAFVLLCTGATERPMPLPGWTLPGVMTVGAAQIALKTSGLLPTGATWIAGQGPLPMLYAAQTLRAGGRLAGILDLSDGIAPLRALRHLPAALRNSSDIAKGLAWRRAIARAGVPWLSATALRAQGDGVLQRITFRAGNRDRSENADLLLLHDGIIPSVQITRALGCAHLWDGGQHCWKPKVDAWGVTSLPNILVAGDGAGIGGARAAALSGRIAALYAAQALGRIDVATRDAAAAPLRAAQARQRALRPLLEALYAPRPRLLDDAATVCRCEEVTAAQIRDAASLGCLGLNQLKAFTRCGMGPCQGRMCGSSAAEVLAAARGVPVAAIEPYRTRFPTKPLTVGELAAMATE